MNQVVFTIYVLWKLVLEIVDNLRARYTNFGRCYSDARLDGQVVVITGGSSGLGKITAELLADRGARIVMACRDLKKAQEAIYEIECKVPGAKLSAVELECSSLDSVRKCAQQLLDQESTIDILINNAGLYSDPRRRTVDGHEIHFGINYLSHFLLTLLLLKRIKSSNGKILNIASEAHRYGTIDFDDLLLENCDSSLTAYGRSKLAQILFSRELAARYPSIKSYSLHPGFVKTDITRESQPPSTAFGQMLSNFVFRTPEEGAQTILHCILDPQADKESGLYYVNCQLTTPIEEARSSEKAKQLWQKSMELVGLSDSDIK